MVVLSPALLLAGCDRAGEPDTSGGRAAPSSAPAGATRGPAGPADVTYTTPPTWATSPKQSPMRKASYVVPRADGDPEDGELSVAQAGGSLDQNIARWAGQFDRKPADVKRHARTVNGLDVTLVEIRGEYAGMAMPGAPAAGKKGGWALLGAIVATNPPTFFKLTGPEKTVTGAQAGFDALVDSLKAK
jgi:hypothetical protein